MNKKFVIFKTCNYFLLDCTICGELMTPQTVIWKEENRPTVQHTNFVCKCGNSEYKRYVLVSR